MIVQFPFNKSNKFDSGVISTLSSYVFKTALATPGLSLGASGAIMAILAFVCVQYPDTQLGIIFLPMLTFSAGAVSIDDKNVALRLVFVFSFVLLIDEKTKLSSCNIFRL